MDQIIVSVDDRLANPGDTWSLAGHLDEAAYSLGDHNFELPGGIDYDVVLTNAGEGILATGLLRAQVVGTCDRCLEPAQFDVAGELQEYYLFHEPEGADEDDDYELLGEDRKIDLAEPISDAVVMDTPFVVLCRPDCRGLCPICGANLNEETCDCAERAEEERIMGDDNPFAALKNLKLDD